MKLTVLEHTNLWRLASIQLDRDLKVFLLRDGSLSSVTTILLWSLCNLLQWQLLRFIWQVGGLNVNGNIVSLDRFLYKLSQPFQLHAGLIPWIRLLAPVEVGIFPTIEEYSFVCIVNLSSAEDYKSVLLSKISDSWWNNIRGSHVNEYEDGCHLGCTV